MEWAVVYSATIFCIAWIVPKIYAIAVQAAYIEQARAGQPEAPKFSVKTGYDSGGYS